MNYDQICYKKSCLSKVIIRLDFLEFIDEKIVFGTDIEKAILNSFPKKGMKQLVRFQTMNFTADNSGTRAEHSTLDGVQQEFLDVAGNKTVIANKFIVLEINKYDTYEDVLMKLEPIIKELLGKQELTIIRIGIRYINYFGEDGIRPQKNYFTPQVGSLLEAKRESSKCIRAMAMDECLVDNMHLNFRFGMFNPQYPQVIKKMHYVLDYDCFCDEATEGYEAIMGYINKGHDAIQSKFEESITDQLRKVMQNE